MNSKGNKIEILKIVLKKKRTLFEALSDKLTKIDQMKEWDEVHKKAQALGHCHFF